MGCLGNWQRLVRMVCILLPVLKRAAVSQIQWLG